MTLSRPKKMTAETIAELLRLYKSGGWTIKQLGIHFKVDRTVIYYWIYKDKQGKSLIPVGKGGKIKNQIIAMTNPAIKNPLTGKELLPREKVNAGRFYKDYLKIYAAKIGKTEKSLLPYRGNYKNEE